MSSSARDSHQRLSLESASVPALVGDDVGLHEEGSHGHDELDDGGVDRGDDACCPKVGFSEANGLDRAVHFGFAPTLEVSTCPGGCLGFAFDWGFKNACFTTGAPCLGLDDAKSGINETNGMSTIGGTPRNYPENRDSYLHTGLICTCIYAVVQGGPQPTPRGGRLTGDVTQVPLTTA